MLSITQTAGPADANKTPGIIAMSGVGFTWPGPRGFSLTIDKFELTARERVLLVGPSGSGKSTFLNLLTGIVAPSSGRLELLGSDIAKFSNSARDHFRAEHIGIIFQMFNLLPYGSVTDNVVLPLSFAKTRRERALAGGTHEGEAKRLLSSLGLDAEAFEGVAASSLSVGQQQRVAAARALIGRPELIVADEPTSALDRDSQLAFLDLLFAEVEAADATLIMVSHDESLGQRFDRVIHLDDIAVSQRTRNAP